MPELPEVETVRAGLAAELIGATVKSVSVHDARSLKRHPGDASSFASALKGARVRAVVRRGKFLWIPFDSAHALVGHLGMSGQILLRTPDFDQDRHTRITLSLEGADGGPNLEMRFIDQRLFGGLMIDEMVPTADGFPGGYSPEAAASELLPASVAHIARDLLDPHFDSAAVVANLARRDSGIKRLLLDQGVLSGIGNIYADEALWRSKLHYDQPGKSIAVKRLRELLQNSMDVLAEAVARGGTSFDEQYKNVNGESGYFSQLLNAYGQTNEPCNRCGTPIVREAWANRGSHFCPNCQRLF